MREWMYQVGRCMPPKPDYNMLEDIWNESSFAGAIYDIGVEDGLTIACEEAHVAGMRAFAPSRLRAFAQKVLERRFGPLHESLRAALWAADTAALVEILAELTTLDDVKARLGIS